MHAPFGGGRADVLRFLPRATRLLVRALVRRCCYARAMLSSEKSLLICADKFTQVASDRCMENADCAGDAFDRRQIVAKSDR